jgi:hypothetical protein
MFAKGLVRSTLLPRYQERLGGSLNHYAAAVQTEKGLSRLFTKKTTA